MIPPARFARCRTSQFAVHRGSDIGSAFRHRNRSTTGHGRATVPKVCSRWLRRGGTHLQPHFSGESMLQQSFARCRGRIFRGSPEPTQTLHLQAYRLLLSRRKTVPMLPAASLGQVITEARKPHATGKLRSMSIASTLDEEYDQSVLAHCTESALWGVALPAFALPRRRPNRTQTST